MDYFCRYANAEAIWLYRLELVDRFATTLVVACIAGNINHCCHPLVLGVIGI
jgi:hypothetical protein